MADNKEQAVVFLTASYVKPAFYAAYVTPKKVLCGSPIDAVGTEWYEEGEEYGEDW